MAIYYSVSREACPLHRSPPVPLPNNQDCRALTTLIPLSLNLYSTCSDLADSGRESGVFSPDHCPFTILYDSQ